MPVLWLILAVLLIGALAFVLGRGRALASAGGNARALHSLPVYYGANALLFATVAPLGLMCLWLITSPLLIDRTLSATIPAEEIQEGSSVGLVMADIRRLSEGLSKAVTEGAMTEDEVAGLDAQSDDIRAMLAEVGVALGSDVTPTKLSTAQDHRAKTARSNVIMTALVLVFAVAGLAWAYARTHRDFRARNTVEQAILFLLIGAALLAILTTVGIVLSLLGNTVQFFRIWPASDFFFNLTWQPSFGDTGSQLGFFPLLWGTLYISVVALAVATPIGLFAAIYLSEYATTRTRSFAKPLLELLAGIPTIVYGLFALLTIGPMLSSVFGRGGVGQETTLGLVVSSGLGGIVVAALVFAIVFLILRGSLKSARVVNAVAGLAALGVGGLVTVLAFSSAPWMGGDRAVMTAGLVMGVMLIPFVSSLSDDIINAVPQAMRDGSLGLGATKSETVRQVVLPAALPGIVGAILLAASRAIGETMIVVLGAGAAARLSMNPFEAMTTVTAKIVSQLTGDADFASPQALVAFALGMALFVITLGLNIFALYIVRKYREQYD